VVRRACAWCKLSIARSSNRDDQEDGTHFLTSADHLSIEHAIRRAELVALGAPDGFVQAVLASRLAIDLRKGEFWRTVWAFLIANARAMDPAQIGPTIDFVQTIRHDRVAVETRDGIVMRDPPQPSFSLKGRTVQSMFRLMQDWHRGLGVADGGLTWGPSLLQPMLIEEPSRDPSAPPSVWQLMELTNGAQLRTEGTALRHCVASYADRCWRGASRIWSLRVHRGERVRHLLTIEVDMTRRAVVQARGWGNRAASGKPCAYCRTGAFVRDCGSRSKAAFRRQAMALSPVRCTGLDSARRTNASRRRTASHRSRLPRSRRSQRAAGHAGCVFVSVQRTLFPRPWMA
jgi:hypothetical protein